LLADKIGRLKVVLGGYTALLLVYLLLFGPFGGWPLLVVVLTLHGIFYASTDGLLIALAGPMLPTALRPTGIALIQTGQALSYLLSSVLFGLAWTVWGPASATRIAAALVAVAVLAVALLLRGIPSETVEQQA
jgi:MFS family permease